MYLAILIVILLIVIYKYRNSDTTQIEFMKSVTCDTSTQTVNDRITTYDFDHTKVTGDSKCKITYSRMGYLVNITFEPTEEFNVNNSVIWTNNGTPSGSMSFNPDSDIIGKYVYCTVNGTAGVKCYVQLVSVLQQQKIRLQFTRADGYGQNFNGKCRINGFEITYIVR